MENPLLLSWYSILRRVSNSDVYEHGTCFRVERNDDLDEMEVDTLRERLADVGYRIHYINRDSPNFLRVYTDIPYSVFERKQRLLDAFKRRFDITYSMDFMEHLRHIDNAFQSV
jgi:hypothetical protein